QPSDDQGHPDAMFSVIGDVAAFDHWRQQVTLLASAIVRPGASTAELNEAYDDAVARLEGLARAAPPPPADPLLDPPDVDEPVPEVRSTLGSDAYGKAVEVAREHIAAGDVFQVVLSQRFDADLDAYPF